MKKILLAVTTFLFLIDSSQSKEIDIEGEMICKVKSNYVVEINEGKPEFYSGVEGSFKKGDNLVFKFYTDNVPGFANIKLYYKDKLLGTRSVTNSKYSDEKIELTDDGFKFGSRYRYVNFYSDSIFMKLTGRGEFRIQRYYKGDWNGIISGWFFSDKGGLGEKVATLD